MCLMIASVLCVSMVTAQDLTLADLEKSFQKLQAQRAEIDKRILILQGQFTERSLWLQKAADEKAAAEAKLAESVQLPAEALTETVEE